MKAIQRINHNAAICVDGAGRQLIAMGKGIGFGDYPHEVALKDIQRTFYGVDPKYLAFIEEVDPEVLEFSAQLADLAVQQLSYELSPNLPITLADHIQFAIKRAREHMVITLPATEDIQQTHPVEFELGKMAVRGIRRTFKVRMPASEAGGIALSIVNSAVRPSERQAKEDARCERMLECSVAIVEGRLGPVDRGSFAYARFATHMRYLLARVSKGEAVESENSDLYGMLVEQYPKTAACAQRIGGEIEAEYGMALTHEELVYLIMHINRLVADGEGEGEDEDSPEDGAAGR